MKTKLIPILITAAAICVSCAQTTPSTSKISDRVAYEIGAENRESPRSTATLNQQDDELQAEKEKLAMLRLKYTEVHPEVVAAKNRIAQLEGSSAYQKFSSSGGGSVGRFGQRLQAVVRRGDGALPGSIILTSAMSQEKLDQLSEDLTVLNYIFTRNFERTFGEKGTEYRLGVPITMSGGRMVETSYLEDFGVLIKVHVPFPVVSSGDNDKKAETTTNADSDWEKARHALFGGGDGDVAAPATEQIAPYDEKLVSELKRQMFDALKSAANIRNLENQAITAVIVGSPNFPTRRAPRTGAANGVRSTVMTIRITKAQADAASKNPDANDLAKLATVVGYFDSANANADPRGVTTYGGGGFSGGYGSSFGGGGGGYGGYPPLANPVGR